MLSKKGEAALRKAEWQRLIAAIGGAVLMLAMPSLLNAQSIPGAAA